MKTSGYIKNDKGIALVAALIVMLLLLVLGAAAMQMSTLGFTSISAEKKYQIANWAAEYAVQEGIRVTVAANLCPEGSGTGTAGSGNYTYYRVPSSNLCYIYGTGTFAGAKVVKNVVVPRLQISEIGAITLRNGGSLGLGGSSSIVNCDTDCKTPGVVYGTGLTLAVNTINDDVTCPNNPRGIYGSPYAVQDVQGDACNVTNGSCSASPQMEDRIPVMFEANNWGDLITRLSNSYGVNVSALSISIPTPPDPPGTCECTDAGNFTLAATTNSCAGITNITASGCTSLEFTSSTNTLTIAGIPAAITNVVSNKNVTITGSLNVKNVFTTGTANITIDGNNVDITNANLIAVGVIDIDTVRNINNSILATTGNARNILIKSGTIRNSSIYTGGTDSDILFTGGTLNINTLLTKDLFRIDNSANATIMTDNKVFAQSIGIVKGSGDISGGLFYSQANTTFLDSTGNTRIGCVNLGNSPTIAQICAADCNPVLFIIGGNLNLEGRGTVDIFGTVFVNGVINYSGGGGFAITGSVVSNSTTGTSSFSGNGNANIRFSSCIMNYIRSDHTIARIPACGGGGARGPYITNTKITVY